MGVIYLQATDSEEEYWGHDNGGDGSMHPRATEPSAAIAHSTATTRPQHGRSVVNPESPTVASRARRLARDSAPSASRTGPVPHQSPCLPLRPPATRPSQITKSSKSRPQPPQGSHGPITIDTTMVSEMAREEAAVENMLADEDSDSSSTPSTQPASVFDSPRTPFIRSTFTSFSSVAPSEIDVRRKRSRTLNEHPDVRPPSPSSPSLRSKAARTTRAETQSSGTASTNTTSRLFLAPQNEDLANTTIPSSSKTNRGTSGYPALPSDAQSLTRGVLVDGPPRNAFATPSASRVGTTPSPRKFTSPARDGALYPALPTDTTPRPIPFPKTSATRVRTEAPPTPSTPSRVGASDSNISNVRRARAAAAEKTTRPKRVLTPVQQDSPPSTDAVLPSAPIEVVFPVPSLDVFDVPVSVVAHNRVVQKEMDRLGLAWGTQYEIARGVTCCWWTWNDVTRNKLNQLRGTNAEASWKVPYILRDERVPATLPSFVSILEELDREQAAIEEGLDRGLGLMGEWHGAANWYGGQVQQCLQLVKAEREDSTTEPYAFRLKKMESPRSNRFARLLGSRSLISLKIASSLSNEYSEVLHFLRRKFVLCGRVFLPFHAKDDALYLFETKEDFDRKADPSQGDHRRLDMKEFVELHNPLSLNSGQSMSKWSTRWAQGLSTSVPVLEFESDKIHFIEDVVAGSPPDGTRETNSATEEIMTDGCGWVNADVLLLIKQVMNFSNSPVAIQGRIAGSKGLWLLHPHHQDAEGHFEIWIRSSQRKVQLPPLDQAHRIHRIFDLVAPARQTSSGRLSQQTILNLAHNGVPHEVFENLLRRGLEEEVERLTRWDGNSARLKLLDHEVSRAGGVMMKRLYQQAAGTGRAMGLCGREQDRDEEDYVVYPDDELVEHGDRSREPELSVYESVVDMLRAGFHPLKSRPLFDKLEKVVTLVIDSWVKRYHINVPNSAEAFIVPDPLDQLEEGEVYFQASQPLEGKLSRILEGHVLLSRNPTCVASDIQKVTAVNRPKLVNYVDVVVVSTKGSRSLASYLSGGDYDGDTVLINWDPAIVKPFKNAPLRAPSSTFIEQNYERGTERVPDFCRRTSELPIKQAHLAFQKVLLLGLVDRKLGVYSNYHDIALHTLGYGHEETEKLAFKFCLNLDSEKSGLRLKDSVVRGDRLKYDRAKPPCMCQEEHVEQANMTKLDLRPGKPIPKCILCILVDIGRRERDRHLAQYESMKKDLDERPDPHLLQPCREEEARAQTRPALKWELERIKDHVDERVQAWSRLWQHSTPSRTPSSTRKGKRSASSAKLNNELRKLINAFHKGPNCEFEMLRRTWREVMVSYAYQKHQTFAFSVAFRMICGLKADAKGRAPITYETGQLLSMNASIVKVMQKQADST